MFINKKGLGISLLEGLIQSRKGLGKPPWKLPVLPGIFIVYMNLSKLLT